MNQKGKGKKKKRKPNQSVASLGSQKKKKVRFPAFTYKFTTINDVKIRNR